jgi:DNA-binding beta-propeller fold protein YncE
MVLRVLIFAIAVLAGCGPSAISQGSASSLILESTISLPNVKGRIDHLAMDIEHQKLFVAELENGTVEAIDLATGQLVGRISGLREPQGLAYLPARGELVVASGDGTVRFYGANDLSLLSEVTLGDDADNVRISPKTGSVVVGYGAGALAIIDPSTRKVSGTITLSAHPESFRIDAEGRRVFVNLPGAGKVAVADLEEQKVTATRGAGYGANYPMMYDPSSNSIAVGYRLPARLVISDADGKVLRDIDTCGDSDDLFFDLPRKRIYVTCGSGEIDVFSSGTKGYQRTARIKTRDGARTSLFSPDLDRLYVAARAAGGKPAAILVFRPN